MENVTRTSGRNGFEPSISKTGALTPVGRSSVDAGATLPLDKSTRADAPLAQEALSRLGMQTLEALLPPSVLQSPRWMETEWAWRRVLFQESASQLSQSDLPNFWRLLGELASETSSNRGSVSPQSRIEVSDWPFSSPVLPYSQLDESSLKTLSPHLPSHLLSHVLADRMTAAVQSPQSPYIGAGLFLLEAPLPDGRGKAVQWQAERQTKLGAMGQIIHRLEIEVQVGLDPVRISMTFASPHLDLFFATDNAALQESFMTHAAHLEEILKALGVTVERIRAGNMNREENE